MINNEQKNKLSPQEFDKKYETILNELKGMAKKSPEEKAARFHWMKAHLEYDQFIVDIINTSKNNACDTLKWNLEHKVSENFDADAGIATKKKKQLDFLVLVETIKQVIETYTGEEGKKDDKVSFSALVGELYKKKAWAATVEKDIEDMLGGMYPGTPEKNWHYLLRLLRDVKLLKEMEGAHKTTEELIEKVKESINYKFTKKELQIAKKMVNLNIVSFDQPVSKDGEETLQNQWADERQYVQEEVLDAEFFRELSDRFLEKWEAVEDATLKVDREILKAFFSKDLLIALKLEEIMDEAMRKEYKDLLEPNCGQWCSRKNRCPYGKNGCYIRYGMRGECEEYGDDGIYNILKTIKKLYEAILDNDYVRYAYSEPIKGLQDIYEKPLKPFKGDEKADTFRFTNATLAKALGKAKEKISKQRKDYEGGARTTLFEIFQSELY